MPLSFATGDWLQNTISLHVEIYWTQKISLKNDYVIIFGVLFQGLPSLTKILSLQRDLSLKLEPNRII